MTQYISGWPALLGWPAVLVAMALGVLGMAWRRPRYLYTAAILVLPISLYLAAMPRFPVVPLLAPLLLLLSGLAIKRHQTNLAILIVLPVVFFFGWLALVVLQQPGSHT